MNKDIKAKRHIKHTWSPGTPSVTKRVIIPKSEWADEPKTFSSKTPCSPENEKLNKHFFRSILLISCSGKQNKTREHKLVHVGTHVSYVRDILDSWNFR